MNCFKGFAKTIISFLFYIYEFYVHVFLRNTLMQILLIESIFYKKTDQWYIEWQQVVQRVTMNNNEWQKWQWVVQRMSASDKEWQRVTTNDIKWQLVTASGKTNKNGTIHIEQWMIAIFSVTTSRDLWLLLEWLNK